ncbi:hypothetical protein BT69DRAFT_1326833, partial [Atractiella rhizophila]
MSNVGSDFEVEELFAGEQARESSNANDRSRKGGEVTKGKGLAKYEACRACRQKKVRCDGSVPCGPCERSRRGNEQCEYDSPSSRVPEYMLSAKLANLRKEYEALKAAAPSDTAEPPDVSTRKDTPPPPDSDSRTLSTSADSNWPSNLPPRDVALTLAMTAFTRAVFLSDIIHPPTFIHQLLRCQSSLSSVPSLPLLHALCLVGTHSLDEEQVEKMLESCPTYWGRSENNADAGMKKVLLEHHVRCITPAAFNPGMKIGEEELVDLTKSLLVMTTFLDSKGLYDRAIISSGMTMRLCVLLGLNTPKAGRRMDFPLSEQSQREEYERSMLFWLTLAVDHACVHKKLWPSALRPSDFAPTLPPGVPTSLEDFSVLREHLSTHQLCLSSPDFFDLADGLDGYEAHQIFVKIILLSEKTMSFMRKYGASKGMWRDASPKDVRRARENVEFQSTHRLLMSYLNAFPTRFASLSTLGSDELTPAERRERHYYYQAYVNLNATIMALHSAFFSFDLQDQSMLSSYRSARNIFTQFDILKSNHKEKRFLD